MKSNVIFQSNLYPINGSYFTDKVFHSKIHDREALLELKKKTTLSRFQWEELNRTLHCARADKDDYPWGTVVDADGQERIACKCLNQACGHFKECRPDFDPSELLVLEENKTARHSVEEMPLLSDEAEDVILPVVSSTRKAETMSVEEAPDGGNSAGNVPAEAAVTPEVKKILPSEATPVESVSVNAVTAKISSREGNRVSCMIPKELIPETKPEREQEKQSVVEPETKAEPVGVKEDPFIIHTPGKKHTIPAPSAPEKLEEETGKTVDFSSFKEVLQDDIINADAPERTIVNAGPGTGKTWTLIEKIIFMVNECDVAPENILVMCFSRAAVEVVKTRLEEAAENGRIDIGWRDIDVRTFDSFATCMLVWVEENCPELLPRPFALERCDYDTRIRLATDVLKKKSDMLADYEHIIVDEVQDLVGSRAEMVLALLSNLTTECGFTLLGDSCQSLYDYMAANDAAVMSSEKFYRGIFKAFPEANYFALTENHRQGDELGAVTKDYRSAILTGSAQDQSREAKTILNSIPQLTVKLQNFSREDALPYIQQGTLGILTRTNGQALQISSWLQNADIPHSLQRGLGASVLGDWISGIFFDYENESIDETTFVTRHLMLYPDLDYSVAQSRWMALVNTQRDESRQRYEVADLLRGLLCNATEPLLYQANDDQKYAITVSNIHRAKGKEFDSVIVLDDVIEAMADEERADILEHKVCYVALTRPRVKIERAALPARDKIIYTTQNRDGSKRCAKASIRPGHKYISHFEVGSDTDLDMRFFGADKDLQNKIRTSVSSGMRLKLIKCPEYTNPYVTYKIVEEDNENNILGCTSESFAVELEKAIQHILKINRKIYFTVFPHAFCDIYVSKICTCVSALPPVPSGAKTFGDVSIWTGMTVSGFAAVDKDTY